MMYSEFLTLSDMTESYISCTEYTNEIEPIYTECELSKTDFIDLLVKTFDTIVIPAVNKKIENLSIQDKEAMAFDFDNLVLCQEKVQLKNDLFSSFFAL